MNFFKNSYDQLINELIEILLQVKDNIKDNSDCIWTYYETSEEMHNDIDKYVLELKKGSMLFLDEMNMHFLPTAAYQEHAMANNWVKTYYELADRFDKLYDDLKKYKDNS